MGPTARRVLIWGVLAALLAAALVHAFMPQPVPVDLGAAARGALRVTVDDEGRTKVKDIYVVSAPLAGRALRIEIEAGDAVIAGESVVATIYPGDPAFLDVRSQSEAEADVKAAEAARALARAELERTRAEMAFALDDYSRAAALADRQHISERALDAAELEVRTREAAVASAEAALLVRDYELERARAALIEPGQGGPSGQAPDACCVEVRAPIDGRVLRVIHESEGVVAAGEALLEIGDPRALEIVTELLSSDAVKVAPGAEVLIEAWGRRRGSCRTRAPDRAVRFHQGLGAGHRGAARQRHHRLRRPAGPLALARPWLSGRDAHYCLARRRRAQGAGERVVPRPRGLGRVRRRKWGRHPEAGIHRPHEQPRGGSARRPRRG